MTARSITSIRPEQRTTLPGPPDAPFVRQQCVADGHVWIGIVTTEPGGASPWHHHGEHETYVYLLEGEGILEQGDGTRVELRADGSVHVVPKGLPHREINPGATKNRALVMRVGEGPAVVPVEDPT